MTETCYVGIDNGISGALAMLDREGAVVEPLRTEQAGRDTFVDCKHVSEALKSASFYSRVFVVIEGAQKFTLGRLALASTWCAFGTLRAVLRLTPGVSFMVVTPQAWQSKMLPPRKNNPEDTKTASIKAAKELFPGVSLRRSERCRTDDHNMADALLMAEWARRQKL